MSKSNLKVSLNTRRPTTAATGESPQTSGHAALSKDVTLNADKNTWMRIHLPAKLPSNDQTVARLPIILFFHGGGWIQTTVADSTIHESNNLIASEVPSILIAVDFRFPAQYEDAAEAVDWVRNQAADESNGDQWIREYGDFSRCYLYGVDCGADIAFYTAVNAADENIRPLKIAGTILIQPVFGGDSDRDERFRNPVWDGAKKIGRCLVIGIEGEGLKELVRMMVQEGVTVETHFEDTKRPTTILNFIKLFV